MIPDYIKIAVPVVLGGLSIGWGLARIWTQPSKIKKPRIPGQRKAYYTMGELWWQKTKESFRQR